MREILFRGKRLDNGEWVEGYYVYDESGQITEKSIAYIYHLHTHPCGWAIIPYVVDPSTVGQYTGMTAYGKKIFERDILKFSYAGQNKGVEGVAVVEFENGKFGVKWGWHKEFVTLDGFANTTIEVVGNIHDNPELIGGEQCTLGKS